MADRDVTKIRGPKSFGERVKEEKNLQAEDRKRKESRTGISKVIKTSKKTQKTSVQEIGRTIISHIRSGRKGDIPFFLPTMMKKSQIVELKMQTNYAKVTTSTGIAYSGVSPCLLSTFIDATDVIDLFDEYRPIRGKAYYIPRYNFGSTPIQTGGAAIDFANATPFSNSQTMLNHDNSVMFDLLRMSQHPTVRGKWQNASAVWEIRPDSSPDENWVDTAASTPICWWKAWFEAVNVSSSLDIGYLVFEMVFQFRGLK